MVSCRKYLNISLSSFFSLMKDLMMPTEKMAKLTRRKKIMTQAGTESKMWYLSCQPSVTLFRVVIITLIMPRRAAKGMQRSKSRVEEKVMVHPKPRKMRRQMISESETEYMMRQMTYINLTYSPFKQAQQTNPMYLSMVAANANIRLSFTIYCTQFYYQLFSTRIATMLIMINIGRSHAQTPYEYDQCSPFISIFNLTLIVDPFEKFYCRKVWLQSRRTMFRALRLLQTIWAFLRALKRFSQLRVKGMIDYSVYFRYFSASVYTSK